MDIAFDSQKKHPLDFSEVPSLQALAATKVALCLWQYKICRGVTQHNPTYWLVQHRYWFEGINEFSCREILTVPTRIRNLIDEQIVPVQEELRILLKKFASAWTEFSLPNDRGDLLILTLFDNVVLKPDNTICLVSSTKKTLSRLTFREVNSKLKYKLACEFCVVDCVGRYWRSVKNHFVAKEQSEQSPLVLYWNNKKGIVFNPPPPPSRLEENPVILLEEENNKAAFTFFWKKLNKEKQKTLTINILRNPNTNYRIVKYLLAKLNKMQARKVCQEAGNYIISKAINTDQDFEYIIKCWMFMKDFISENVFFEIISLLWQIVLNNSTLHRDTINQHGALLHAIWITASSRSKAFVLERDRFVGLFDSPNYQVQGAYNSGEKFMLALLNDAGQELRRNVWLEHWRKFIVRFQPSNWFQLMKLCLAEEEEIQRFRERMSNFEELGPYFSPCIERKLITELCQFLNFCVKDPRRLENLSKEIIISNLHAIVCYVDENDLANFRSFIRGTFRHSQSANKFMEELILAEEFLALMYSKLDEGCYDEIINISGRFSTSERNLTEMKRRLLEYCRGNMAGPITGFDGQKLENFLNWCSLDETSISEFKQSLIIDEIFGKILRKESCRFIFDFNNFLVWYFGSAEKAKIYKSSESVDGVLNWAFDNDTNKINRVKNILQK